MGNKCTRNEVREANIATIDKKKNPLAIPPKEVVFPPPTGKWLCDKCTFHNPENEELRCIVCGTDRPTEDYSDVTALTRFPLRASMEYKLLYYRHFLREGVDSIANDIDVNDDVQTVILQFLEMEFYVGMKCDVQDKVNKWYVSTVKEIKPDQINIHYDFWSDKWDEWVDKDSTRVAMLHTHTTEKKDEEESRLMTFMESLALELQALDDC